MNHLFLLRLFGLALIKLLGGTLEGVENLGTEALRLVAEKVSPCVAELVGHLTNPNFDEMVVQAQMRGDNTPPKELKNRFWTIS